jgi:hypothetical protein
MRNDLKRAYESQHSPHFMVERIHEWLRHQHRFAGDVSDDHFSVHVNWPMYFEVYGTIASEDGKTVIRVSYLRAVWTMVTFGLASGAVIIWLLIDSLMSRHNSLPFLLIAFFWSFWCWYGFRCHILAGFRILNELERTILSDELVNQ